MKSAGPIYTLNGDVLANDLRMCYMHKIMKEQDLLLTHQIFL